MFIEIITSNNEEKLININDIRAVRRFISKYENKDKNWTVLDLTYGTEVVNEPFEKFKTRIMKQ